MAGEDSYWTRRVISRRAALRGAAAGSGLAAIALAACRGSSPQVSRQTTSGAGGPVLDTTKGKPGGVFLQTRAGFPASLDLTGARQPAAAHFAGLVHSGLLGYRCGRPGVDGTDISVEPDVCQAMPEQPDPLTYVFKVIPGIKFHNGRGMTSDDIKYSLERYGFSDKSAFRDSYTWIDKVDAADAQTVIVKTKAPYADAVQALAMYNDSRPARSTRYAGEDGQRRRAPGIRREVVLANANHVEAELLPIESVVQIVAVEPIERLRVAG
ncbi:MAG TPA: ABC transporter substrate-binding protein [Dehalococcoidia bacterium]|nr:ABC transporter substrate-binding protein [Dehalococcoidia bacterium]